MELENYLRSLVQEPQERPDHFGEGVEVNSGEAILETHGGDLSVEAFSVSEDTLPEEISLLVTLSRERILDVMPGYRLGFISKGSVTPSTALSQFRGGSINHCCRSLEIHWQGKGSQKGDYGLVEDLCSELLALPKGAIHRKPFNAPPGNSFSMEEIYTSDLKWVYGCPSWDKPRQDEHPLIPFGGYCGPDLDFEKMAPMYGNIEGGDTTGLTLRSQKYWQDKGAFPGYRGIQDRVAYSLIPSKESVVQTSMAQDIRGGSVRVGGEGMLYVSHGFDVLDPVTNTFLIHFKQG